MQCSVCGEPAPYKRLALCTKHYFSETKDSILSHTPEYRAWSNMRHRCNSPKNRAYKDYGGRGINVCEQWERSFAQFLNDVGLRPSSKYSLDRINNNGNYEPGNVRWALVAVQHANRRPCYITAKRLAELLEKEKMFDAMNNKFQATEPKKVPVL